MVLPLNPMGVFSPIQSVPVRSDIAPAAPVAPAARTQERGPDAFNHGIAPDGGRGLLPAQAEGGGFRPFLALAADAPPVPTLSAGPQAVGWPVSPTAFSPATPGAARVLGYSALSRGAAEAAPSGQMVSVTA